MHALDKTAQYLINSGMVLFSPLVNPFLTGRSESWKDNNYDKSQYKAVVYASPEIWDCGLFHNQSRESILTVAGIAKRITVADVAALSFVVRSSGTVS